ncbi:MAG: SpoIID/LytB domain-containing protein [Actinomycetota bacterium]
MAAKAQGPTPAFVFSGGGWGHGLGLSQWGAKGQADAGRTSAEILTHYYQGTTLETGKMPAQVRVGLLWDMPSIDLSASGKFEVRYGSPEGEIVATGSADKQWNVSTDASGSLLLSSAGERVSRPGATAALFVVYGPHGSLLRLPQTGNRYKHGTLQIDTYKKGETWLIRATVTGMGMQHYLYGLGEVPSLWPEEALKAQAIAGRTYALEKLTRLGQARTPCNCGMFPSTIDQVYVGFEKEGGEAGDRWRAAVDATDGRILTLNGRPIEAVYHSSSGGHTENNEFVWGGPPLPYLRGVPDPWDTGPRRSWSVRLTQQELADRLESSPATNAGMPATIEILGPEGVSGRVRSVLSDTQGGVRITGSGGTKRVSGSALKRQLGLLSTLFWQGEPKAPLAVPVPVPVPPEVVAAAPAAHPETPKLPNGTLVKGPDPAIYLLAGGKKRPFASPGALSSHFPGAVATVIGSEQITSYELGHPVGYRDGTLLSRPGTPVWLISEGKRRGFTSAHALTKSGYSFKKVVSVRQEEIEIFEEGFAIADPKEAPFNGTLVKGSGPTVYLIEAAVRRPITSPAVLESRFRWNDVVKVSDAALARFPAGAAVGFAEGTILRTGSELWVISDGQRRPISTERLQALGLQEARIRGVSAPEAQLHALGDPL